ncbi:MAG: hypothetical protein J6X78_03160 [Treponema sp.]|nr:hypothetical protein [Treponema sp.]
MKRKNPLFSIILLGFLIFSCSQTSFKMMEEKTSDSFITITLQGLSSRTILPEKYNYTDFEYELYGTDSNGEQSLMQHWITYESMVSSKVNIKPGEWILELHALKNSEIALTGVVYTNIQFGENSVSFTLTESSYGNGNLFIELYVSENTAQKIEAVILKDDGLPMEEFGKTILLSEYDSIKGEKQGYLSIEDIPKGYYLIRFFLYKNETDVNYSSVYNTFARIEPCFTSAGIEEIDLLESLYEVSIPLDHIEIATKPNTTIYYVDQNLSLEGLEVNACYKDGRKEKITNYTTSIEDGGILAQTDRLVTIAYGEYTDSIEITVLPNSLEGIYVTVPTMEQDISDLLSYSYSTNIFTAKNGFSTYEWWLDEEKLNNQTRYFTIDSSKQLPGNHNLMLVVQDYSGKKYSASSEFVICDSSLSFIKFAIENITEVSNLLSFDETSFTASSGFTMYTWWIDDIKQTVNAAALALPENLTSGHHTVTVIVKDNQNNYFSETKTVSITKENLKLDEGINTKVIIKVSDYQDINDLLLYDESLKRFIAKKGYSNYAWWIDGIKQNETKSYYEITDKISKGNHSLIIVVQNSGGNYYSTTKNFYVSTENLQLDDNSDTTKIYISFNDYVDITDLITYESENQKFNAKNGYTTYSWWIDGTKTNETSKSFIFKESDYPIGNHTVMLVVKDSSGNTYSASKIFTISGTYTDTNCANTVIYVVLPKYQEVKDLLIYEDSLFYAKTGFVTYAWWVDDVKTSQEGKRFSIGNLSRGNHSLMLVVESESGNVYSATSEIVIY